MSALNSSAPSQAPVREHDPEIKDMASYIHNYKVNSDLAVWNYQFLNNLILNYFYESFAFTKTNPFFLSLLV